MPMPGPAIRGSRSLLRQIREAMESGGPVQARLDMAVRIIAGSMVAEVCSLYLRRGSGDLELFATEGLSREAVHVTRLGPGVGLVGEIVKLGRPLNLSDAPNHPAFAYRPETGEDPYHAFLGVPLLPGGRPLRVLGVQNRTAPNAPMARRRSRISRSSPWSWPRWSPAANWSPRARWRSRRTSPSG